MHAVALPHSTSHSLPLCLSHRCLRCWMQLHIPARCNSGEMMSCWSGHHEASASLHHRPDQLVECYHQCGSRSCLRNTLLLASTHAQVCGAHHRAAREGLPEDFCDAEFQSQLAAERLAAPCARPMTDLPWVLLICSPLCHGCLPWLPLGRFHCSPMTRVLRLAGRPEHCQLKTNLADRCSHREPVLAASWPGHGGDGGDGPLRPSVLHRKNALPSACTAWPGKHLMFRQEPQNRWRRPFRYSRIASTQASIRSSAEARRGTRKSCPSPGPPSRPLLRPVRTPARCRRPSSRRAAPRSSALDTANS
mmetsp:Transcript_99241/g.145140  ORF Transcript_99241/g.145140 Transcript_99241/m.145140 type:complete len:306 (+) Transcript_99241:472-1389(+)